MSQGNFLHDRCVISQKNSYVWEIWDSNSHEIGMDFVDYRNGANLGAHKIANDIIEISSLTKMPLKKLEKTFSNINHLTPVIPIVLNYKTRPW